MTVRIHAGIHSKYYFEKNYNLDVEIELRIKGKLYKPDIPDRMADWNCYMHDFSQMFQIWQTAFISKYSRVQKFILNSSFQG
jgi:hypothetical protein